jgi:hypothetical protein
VNIDREKTDLFNMQENIKELTDCILDLYSKYPEKCKNVLLEISEIRNDLDDIERELGEIEEEMRQL